MIQSGGWNRLRTPDEHTKLARIAIEFDSVLDAMFELNVSKTQVRIPAALRPELGAIASSVAQMAQDIYRSPMPAAPSQDRLSRIEAIQNLVRLISQSLEEVLREELRENLELLSRVLARMSTLQADVARDLAGSDGPRARTPEGQDQLTPAAEASLISA
jgi:hypothetical protein